MKPNTTEMSKIIAAKVNKSATLPLRSAAASRNEMHTDIAAAEDVIDPRNVTRVERDNADGARVPDYYTHGANEYKRGFSDGYEAARNSAMVVIERSYRSDITSAEDVIDPARAPRPIPFHDGRPA